MSWIDWLVLSGTLFFIVGYGAWKTRKSQNIESYLLGNRSMKWWTIGLSIMATQASAITFLSTPGQAYDDGMRFVQFYFGLPIAMVIISAVFVPIYHKLKVYTAYEFLEQRFNVNVRVLTAFLFLVQRGLAAGFTIFAPALVLVTIMDWGMLEVGGMEIDSLYITNIIIGILVIIYTMSGGTKAVSLTQKQQMFVIFGGMIAAGVFVISMLPEDVSFGNAIKVAGKMEKLNALVFEFNWDDKYNIWTGLLGGTFLMLSYFGTDQSQVQRYLGGKSLGEMRLGLMFNALLKIPMQFVILFIGILVFVFYLFNQSPMFFNANELDKLQGTPYEQEYHAIEAQYAQATATRKEKAYLLIEAMDAENETAIAQYKGELLQAESDAKALRKAGLAVLVKADPEADTKDVNYVFLTYVLNYLPLGMIGLLLAVIFSASMSSTSSELNALASTTVVDLYKRLVNPDGDDKHYVWVSRLTTVAWGVFAIGFANIANRFGTLVEAVNILGSIFYGTILGIFLVAFFFKKIGSNATLIGGSIAQVTVILGISFTNIPYLWFNLIGCVLVIGFAFIFQSLLRAK